ncbi:MAG: nucleotidyltransferase domain-containing protein [Anaerolineales bacterium]|nr:nucleotidyltransferase domain-containing protein [Chloroflexota bacterium]MBL7161550.1 nucleotidyltransferase domain-containing protein [Anaerolineales bacterium]
MDLDTWQSRLESELARFVDFIVTHYSPQKIILFGSLAEGTSRLWSDIDLVVIRDTNERFLDRSKELLSSLMPKVGLDLLIYTPAEFEQLCQERKFFREKILKKGKVLYERSN